MSDVLIVGGGFAGVWSAAAAARRRYEAGLKPGDLTISLVAPGDDMVIRPRLYERRPGDMRVPLRRILAPIDVRRVRATAGAIDVERRQVVAFDADGTRHVEHFERLIVATGSRLVLGHLTFPGAERFHHVDTLPAAVALDEHLHALPSRAVEEGRYTAVVVGAGFVGLEIATELVDRLEEIAGAAGRVRAVLVEREDVVGPELGPGPRPEIEDALDELDIERRLRTTVTAYDGRTVTLSDGARIPALTAVWAAGMAASPLTACIPVRATSSGASRSTVTCGCSASSRCSPPATRPRSTRLPAVACCRPASTRTSWRSPPGTTRCPTCWSCRWSSRPRPVRDVPRPRRRRRRLHGGVRPGRARDRRRRQGHKAHDQPEADLPAARRRREDPRARRPPDGVAPAAAGRSRIRAVLDAAREGNSGVLVLRGEAGVDKSALLDDARKQADGMVVLAVEGIESEAQLPYAGLHQMVRPVLDRIDALPRPQARALRGALGMEAGSSDQWFLVSAGVLSLLAEAGERGPVLCLVDDAHWLDAASAESLVFAARRLEAEGVAMIFAAREGEVRSFDAPGLPELHLDGLDSEAAGALLDHRVDVALSPDARRRLIDETGGNPLGLIALASSLSEGQLTGAEPLLDPLPVSARVERAFLSRVRGLPAETQTMLLVAAAEETGELASVLPAAARLDAGLDALDAAEQEGLLRVDGAHVEFRHPLVRSAVYHGAPLSKRRAVHRALADALEGEADADRRAWHLAAGCVEPDPAIASELELAARRAQRRSGFVAGSIAFERAAAITRDDRHRLGLLTGAVECAWFAGRLERVSTLLERARPLAGEPLERAEINKWRGAVEATAGVPAQAREMFVRGASDLAAADADQALYLLSAAAIAAGYAGDAPGVARIAELAAQVPGAESALAWFLVEFLRGMGGYFTGAFEDSARHLRGALELFGEVMKEPTDTLGHLMVAGGAGLFLGDDEAAERFNRRFTTEAREAGGAQPPDAGRPAARAQPDRAGQLGVGRGGPRRRPRTRRADGPAPGPRAHALRSRADRRSPRRRAECRAVAAQARELAAARRLVHVEQTCSWALLGLELGRGDAEAALLRAREIALPPIAVWSGLDRIEAAIRAGARDDAAAWLEPFAVWAQSAGAPWARGAASHCRALLAGDDEDAERLFRVALDEHAGCSRPFERAGAELAFGEFLRRGRGRLEAREHLRAAIDRFETLGAGAWAERAHGELRASGQTARRRDPSTRDDLSPQEIQIARLVAQGMSNRTVAAQLFLSPRTIDFHLRNVFRKLGITSRTQLAHVEELAG